LVAIFFLQVTVDGLELNGALCISGSGTLTGEGSKKGGFPRFSAQNTVLSGKITPITKVIYHYRPIRIAVNGHNCGFTTSTTAREMSLDFRNIKNYTVFKSQPIKML
jgi:hypothetical protein